MLRMKCVISIGYWKKNNIFKTITIINPYVFIIVVMLHVQCTLLYIDNDIYLLASSTYIDCPPTGITYRSTNFVVFRLNILILRLIIVETSKRDALQLIEIIFEISCTTHTILLVGMSECKSMRPFIFTEP